MDDDVESRVDRWIHRVEGHYEAHGRVFRLLWVLVGALVVLAGLALTVLPGPALLVIPLGLAMLAAAFGWARRLLRFSLVRGQRSATWFADAHPAVKLLAGLAGIAAAAAAATLLLR